MRGADVLIPLAVVLLAVVAQTSAVGFSDNVELPLGSSLTRMFTYSYAAGGTVSVTYTTEPDAETTPLPLFAALFSQSQWESVSVLSLCSDALNITVGPAAAGAARHVTPLPGTLGVMRMVPTAGVGTWVYPEASDGVVAFVQCPVINYGGGTDDSGDGGDEAVVAEWVNVRIEAVNPGGRELDTETWPLPMVYAGSLVGWLVGTGALVVHSVRGVVALFSGRRQGQVSVVDLALSVPRALPLIVVVGLLQALNACAFMVYWTHYEVSGERPGVEFAVATFLSAVAMYTSAAGVLGLVVSGWGVFSLTLSPVRAATVLSLAGFAWVGVVVSHLFGTGYGLVVLLLLLGLGRVSFLTSRRSSYELAFAVNDIRAQFAGFHPRPDEATSEYIQPLVAKFGLARDLNARLTLAAFAQFILVLGQWVYNRPLYQYVVAQEVLLLCLGAAMGFLLRMPRGLPLVTQAELDAPERDPVSADGESDGHDPYVPGVTPVRVTGPRGDDTHLWMLGTPIDGDK